jgi:hypothetical protein
MEQKNTCGCEKALSGIKCDVHNCVYNSVGCTCHAPEIAVGPSEAKSSSETVCATFKPKSN